MNNQEAKFILGAYRAGGQDAADAAMAEALAQARRDPALGEWLAREQAHAAAISAKLREVMPPPGLRAAILTGARVSSIDSAERRIHRAWWRQPVWLAAAAALTLLLSVFTGWRLWPVDGATLEDFAVNYVDKGFRLPKHSADLGELKTWLQTRQAPLPTALPAAFASLQALGCKTLDYRGRAVSLVCFERDGKEFHVFVARREDLPRGPETPVGPQWLGERKPGLVAATWTDATHRYVVVTDADAAALRAVL